MDKATTPRQPTAKPATEKKAARSRKTASPDDVGQAVRAVRQGDVPPSLTPGSLEKHVVAHATEAARGKQAAAVRRLVKDERAGTPAERAQALRQYAERGLEHE